MADKTSYRAMKTYESEDMILYQLACDCLSKECNLIIEMRRDKQFAGMIFLDLYGSIKWCSHWSDDWWIRFKKRICASLRMLFIGYIEMEETFIIHGEEHIDSFITALQEAKEKMNKAIEKKKHKMKNGMKA